MTGTRFVSSKVATPPPSSQAMSVAIRATGFGSTVSTTATGSDSHPSTMLAYTVVLTVVYGELIGTVPFMSRHQLT